jgi:hypothetical protein
VATVDEVAVGHAETQAHQEGVQVSPRMHALGTEQACAMRWGVASVEKLCRRALIECVQKCGTRDPAQLGDVVSRQWEKRRVTRQSQGLSRVQGRLAMGE